MKFMDSARMLEIRLNKRIAGFPCMCFVTYLKFLSMIFLLTGFVFLVYFYIRDLDPLDAVPLSCPLFYLVLGMGFFVGFIFVKINDIKK